MRSGARRQRNYLPMQPGDVPATSANTDELDAWVGFKPATPVREGVRRFVEWYREFYGSEEKATRAMTLQRRVPVSRSAPIRCRRNWTEKPSSSTFGTVCSSASIPSPHGSGRC